MARSGIWIRYVMDEATTAFVESLSPETLDVFEVSGEAWRNTFAWKSYRSSQYPDFDICADAFEQQYDLIIAEQVFEHIRHPARAARTIYDGLRPGGHALITVPCLFHVHPTPLDGWRWTPQGLGFFWKMLGFQAETS